MSRKFSFLLALGFLILQPLSVMHMAKHGFVDHKHYGKICDISIVWEQSKIGSTTSNVILPVNVFFVVQNIPVDNFAVKLVEYSLSTPRAPPAIILS